MRGAGVLAFCALLSVAQTPALLAQSAPLSLLDVPFISQSESLCGGAAAAMVLRYWGEQGVSAESFAHLIDRSASGIRTDALISELQHRGWNAAGIEGDADNIRRELARGRPVLTLVEDRPSTFHYVVVVAWHDRGVVLHDPARAPFRVMPVQEFDRRWNAARRWMAIVVPGPAREPPAPAESSRDAAGTIVSVPSACDERIEQGVRLAQANDLSEAERTLAEALECPGAVRELAGVRLLQRRWAEASELAAAAVRDAPGDAYTWKLLATSHFVQDRRLAALDAWNHAGEPTIDLVQIDGLSRTRHAVVEGLLGLKAGDLLTPGRMVRAQRRLAELPAARSSSLEYFPAAFGMATLRGAVSERRLVPAGATAVAALGATAIATRELRLSTGSFTGGGEQVAAAWRFWPQRPRVSAAVAAPAPWGGVWSATMYRERQEFDAAGLAPSDQRGASLELSDWRTGTIRLIAAAGLDRWEGQRPGGHAGGGVQFLSVDRRVDARARVDGWGGTRGFLIGDMSVQARSSPELRGLVFISRGSVQTATAFTPLALWRAGDTGQARPTLLRAHPVLDHGRLRTDRLGRLFAQISFEIQRWWRVAGPVRAAAAAFGDAGRTARMRAGAAQNDVDLGLGARLALAGMSGIFRIDVARGLRDGATAVSFVYEP